MENKFDPLMVRFIDLIDQKYKEDIFETADTYKKRGLKSYNSLKEAFEEDDLDFVSQSLIDLSISFLYPYYCYNELDYMDSKEGLIFERINYQLWENYESNNPKTFITEEDYEWIKNAPSREECIERDKISRNIINNVYM